MREFLLVLKISLIDGLNLNGMKPKNIDKKRLWVVALIILCIPSIGILYRGYLNLISNFSEAFVAISQEGFLVALSYNVISLLTLMFGFTYVSSYFYFSKSTDTLIPLPLKNSSILASKFVMIYLYELVFSILFISPILFNIGKLQSYGFLYYFKSIVSILLVPVFPLGLAAIIMIFLMRLTNLSAKKDLVRSFTLYLSMIVLIGAQLYLRKIFSEIDFTSNNDFFMKLVTDNTFLIESFAYTNPVARWLGLGFVSGDVSNFLNYSLFVIANLLTFAGFIYVGNKIYLEGIIGGNEVASTTKVITDKELDNQVSKRSNVFFSIAKIDFLTIIKTPIFMINCIGVIIILPVILLFSLFNEGTEIKQQILNLQANYQDILPLLIAGGIILIIAMSTTQSTTFSRDGKAFWISRIIPVSPAQHVIGRSIVPFFISLALTIIVVGTSVYFLELEVVTIILITGLALLGVLPIIFLGIAVDGYSPKTTWDNPQRAVKQNLNVLVAFVVYGVLIYGLWKLFDLMQSSFDSLSIVYGIYIVILMIVTVGSFYIASKVIDDKFSQHIN